MTETTIEALRPIQEKYQEITADRTYLEGVLRDGREKAEAVANETLAAAKDALGYTKPL